MSVDAAFKLFDSFEGIIERTAIQNVLEKHFLILLEEYGVDLQEILSMFLADQNEPPIYNNMPMIAGALNWSIGLELRATTPMAKFRKCSTALLSSDEMAEVESTHTYILELLHSYNLQRQQEWDFWEMVNPGQ